MSESPVLRVNAHRPLPKRQLLEAPNWEAAAVIAGLRLATNDKIRAPDRDQGFDNYRNEIMGVMAELAGRNVLERNMANEDGVLGKLFNPKGPEDDVDLDFEDKWGEMHRIEVKGHVRQKRYKLFTINKRAHHHSIKRNATGYVGVLMTMGGPFAAVSNIVPLIKVTNNWTEIKDLNPDRGDPAYVIGLSDFRSAYIAGRDINPNVNPVISPNRLIAIMRFFRNIGESLEDVPELASKVTATEAKEWALNLLYQ